MKYCIHCGTELQDDANFCTNCGQNPNPVAAAAEAVRETASAPVEETVQTPVIEQPQTPVYTEPAAYTQQPYSQQVAPRPSIKMPIIGLALGIAGLCLAIVLGLYGPFGLIGIGVSIAGLIVSSKAKKTNPGSNMAAHGFRLSLVGIILGAILTIIFTILWAAIGHSILS